KHRGEADLGAVVPDVQAAVASAFRDEWGRVVATLIRVTGDWDVAEECAQDAFALALERWQRDGVPRNPGAWLTTTARNRAIDRMRRAATGADKLQEVAVLSADSPSESDDSGVADGDLVPLEEQDRTRWDRNAIDEGVELLDAALRRTQPGPYQVQAAIAACHATAPDAASTDWPQIAALYGELVRMAPTPVVALNRAVAVAMADGPEAGLMLVDELEASGALHGYGLLPATRADLLRRLGRRSEAAAAYRQAIDLAGADPE